MNRLSMRTHPIWMCFSSAPLLTHAEHANAHDMGAFVFSLEIVLFLVFILILTNRIQGFADDGQKTSPSGGFFCSSSFYTCHAREQPGSGVFSLRRLPAHAEHANTPYDIGCISCLASTLYVFHFDTNYFTSTGFRRRWTENLTFGWGFLLITVLHMPSMRTHPDRVFVLRHLVS